MKHEVTGLPVLLIITGLIIVFFIYCGWTDNCLEYAMQSFFHKTINIPYWMSFIISLVGNAFILVFNIVIEMLKMAGI